MMEQNAGAEPVLGFHQHRNSPPSTDHLFFTDSTHRVGSALFSSITQTHYEIQSGFVTLCRCEVGDGALKYVEEEGGRWGKVRLTYLGTCTSVSNDHLDRRSGISR